MDLEKFKNITYTLFLVLVTICMPLTAYLVAMTI